METHQLARHDQNIHEHARKRIYLFSCKNPFGSYKLDAVHQAAMIRLRPILMTSIATIAGHFPLVLVTGAGAAARTSLGLVLVGGMAIGTLLTLFAVSALYVLLAQERRREPSGELSAPSAAH
ncbi:MAG: efflux RND transporter permease subunit [Thermochromatium sp.]